MTPVRLVMNRLFWLVITSCKEAHHIKDSSFFRDLFQANDWFCLQLLNFFWCLHWWIKILSTNEDTKKSNLIIYLSTSYFVHVDHLERQYQDIWIYFSSKTVMCMCPIEQQSIPTSQPSKSFTVQKVPEGILLCWMLSLIDLLPLY